MVVKLGRRTREASIFQKSRTPKLCAIGLMSLQNEGNGQEGCRTLQSLELSNFTKLSYHLKKRSNPATSSANRLRCVRVLNINPWTLDDKR